MIDGLMGHWKYQDLYEAGMGDTVEDIVREMIEGPGAVRQTLRRHLNKE